jgi:predicted DNA-binding transcriptional regulator AlpA
MKELINEREVAKIMSLSVSLVRRWRVQKKGPRYYKIGAAVRYRPEDVVSWLEEQAQGGGQEEAESRKGGIGSPFNREEIKESGT